MEKAKFLMKALNIFIFVSLLVTGSVMLWLKHVQVAFDIYMILAVYMLFTRIEKMDEAR